MTTEEPSAPVAFAQLDRDVFDAELGEALTLLQATKDRQQDDPATPEEIDHKDVELIPNVFQVRGLLMVPSHVAELLALLRQGRRLDPITLWRCGRHALLVDGHHRLEAYRLYALEVKRPVPVPCQWIGGTAVEAMAVAAETNTKVKLPMTAEQRANLAWAMVKAGPERFSKKDTARLSGSSESTVAEMRRVLKELGELAAGIASWMGALMKRKGLAPLTDKQHEERDRLTVEKWVSGLTRAFGDRWSRQPDLVPDVLDRFLGHESEHVARRWALWSSFIGIEKVEEWVEDERNPDF